MKCLLTLALAVFPAAAATMTLDTALAALHKNIDITVDGVNKSFYAGQIGVLFDTGIPALLYCADPFTPLLATPVTVNVTAPSGLPKGQQIAWIFSNYSSTITKTWQAAALQLAAWELSVDGDGNLDTGRIRSNNHTDAQTLNFAKTMLTASAGQSSSAAMFYVPSTGPGYSQTLFGANFVTVSTPETGSFWMLGAGLVAVGVWRRRAN